MRQQTDESLIQDFRRRNPQARPRATRVEKLQPVSSDASNTSLEKDHDLVKVIKYGEVSLKCVSSLRNANERTRRDLNTLSIGRFWCRAVWNIPLRSDPNGVYRGATT